jgi:integrase
MRRGECLGLRWFDVDLAAGRVSISQTVIMVHHDIQVGSPKTSRGRRTVALDPETVAALREHRRRQLAERMLMGAGFSDHGLVFCRPDGGPLHPERFSRTFSRETAHAGLPAIRLHDLRHTWATLALSAGEHRRWCRSGWATPTCRSRWMSTAMSAKVCTAVQHPASPRSFSGRLAIR